MNGSRLSHDAHICTMRTQDMGPPGKQIKGVSNALFEICI